MQLWLLGYCYRPAGNNRLQPSLLEESVRTECRQYLVNTTPTPAAELLYWRLLTWTASNDTVRHPVTTINADCTQVNHLGIELNIDSWRGALRELLGSADDLLAETLLLGLKEVPIYPVSTLYDTPSDTRPGKSFLDDYRNRLYTVDDWLFTRLHTDPDLVSRFFKQVRKDKIGPNNPPTRPLRVRQSAVNIYLHLHQRFLRLLAVLIYWSSGLPPRRKELAMVQWCNGESVRNIYLLDGSVVLLTGYHKSQWRIGTRPVARFLAPAVGDLLVRYLIYVPPFLRFLYHC